MICNRRGVYTFWQRSGSSPRPGCFDAPTREECTINRTTPPPLQALVLITSPIYVEALVSLAQKRMKQGRTLNERIDWPSRAR